MHHFISSAVWGEAPLEEELAVQADKLIGGANAVLVVDDTALPKKGAHSVGVAPQYASALGKTANCQTLVSLTLARDEVPVMIGLRLFLPESWTGDAERMTKARVPEDRRLALTKPETALAEIDRVRAAGVRFPVGDRTGSRSRVTSGLSRRAGPGAEPERWGTPVASYVAELMPDARPPDRGKPRDEQTEGGNQPANKSLINRRLKLRSRLCAAPTSLANGYCAARSARLRPRR